MSTDNAKDDLSLEMSLEEMALEVVDMLGVALYFAGAKKSIFKHLQKPTLHKWISFMSICPKIHLMGKMR